MAEVSIPLLLADVTGGARHADVPGGTLEEIITALDAIHPGIRHRIHNGQKLSPNLAFTIDGRIATEGLAARVRPESQISILPAFGGG